MKLVYKGIFKSEDQLPIGNLPENAIKFDEAGSMDELGKAVIKPSIFTGLFVGLLFVLVSLFVHGKAPVELIGVLFGNSARWGFGLWILSLFVHEILHAICFGKDDEVELYISLAFWFVICVQPITKARFIFLSLLPNIVLGWIPLLLWVVLPYSEAYSSALFAFGALSTLAGAGDYLNAYNAIRQMPKGSMQQLSGMNSYWFMP